MKQIYIAGPMSNLPDFNFPVFHETAKKLRKDGWFVHNPAEKDEEAELSRKARKTGDTAAAIAGGFDFREAYLWDLEKVITGDAIYLLKGWEQSPGARGEYAAAYAIKKHYPEYEIIYE